MQVILADLMASFPCSSRKDLVQWLPMAYANFTTASAWDQLRPSGPKVACSSLVWPGCIPRASFICG